MYLLEQMYVDKELPKGWKPYYIYAIMVENIKVGNIILRMGDREERYIDGHIGYSIDKAYQGHHYAYLAMELCKDIAREKGFTELILTCDPSNVASKKTIIKLNATYIETKIIPSHLKKYFNPEEKEKEIYIVTL